MDPLADCYKTQWGAADFKPSKQPSELTIPPTNLQYSLSCAYHQALPKAVDRSQ